MADRRRINPPPGGTSTPIYASSTGPSPPQTRTRRPDELRKIFLKTHVTPSATGSAYLELAPPPTSPSSLGAQPPSLKITATVHLAPLPRSAPFTPNLLLSAHVKFAPFATPARRGYVRDAAERELSVRVENALRGAVVAERWPKMGLDVSVVVLEGEDVGPGAIRLGDSAGEAAPGRRAEPWWATMAVVAGCVNAASAAVVDAGIDCVDAVAAGVAAVVPGAAGGVAVVLDPVPREHAEVLAGAVVAYLPTRDEITEVWVRGDPAAANVGVADLVDAAASAAVGARTVILEAAKEEAEARASTTMERA